MIFFFNSLWLQFGENNSLINECVMYSRGLKKILEKNHVCGTVWIAAVVSENLIFFFQPKHVIGFIKQSLLFILFCVLCFQNQPVRFLFYFTVAGVK